MFSTPELCHSALVDLFKEPHNYDLPEGFTRRWEKYKASRKIDEGKKRLTGALATEGADALSVSGYKGLAFLAFMAERFYVSAFLVLAWNIMTRSMNTSELRLRHMWGMYFQSVYDNYFMKSNPRGTTPGKRRRKL